MVLFPQGSALFLGRILVNLIKDINFKSELKMSDVNKSTEIINNILELGGFKNLELISIEESSSKETESVKSVEVVRINQATVVKTFIPCKKPIEKLKDVSDEEILSRATETKRENIISFLNELMGAKPPMYIIGDNSEANKTAKRTYENWLNRRRNLIARFKKLIGTSNTIFLSVLEKI